MISYTSSMSFVLGGGGGCWYIGKYNDKLWNHLITLALKYNTPRLMGTVIFVVWVLIFRINVSLPCEGRDVCRCSKGVKVVLRNIVEVCYFSACMLHIRTMSSHEKSCHERNDKAHNFDARTWIWTVWQPLLYFWRPAVTTSTKSLSLVASCHQPVSIFVSFAI